MTEYKKWLKAIPNNENNKVYEKYEKFVENHKKEIIQFFGSILSIGAHYETMLDDLNDNQKALLWIDTMQKELSEVELYFKRKIGETNN